MPVDFSKKNVMESQIRMLAVSEINNLYIFVLLSNSHSAGADFIQGDC
jgi:hypothetical protein